MSLDLAAVSPDAIPGTAPSVGATVWLTGLPSAGKTTIAFALAQRLRDAGRAVEVLDGDAVRAILSPELGYSRTDRDTVCWRSHRSCRRSPRRATGYAASTRPPRHASSRYTWPRRRRSAPSVT